MPSREKFPEHFCDLYEVQPSKGILSPLRGLRLFSQPNPGLTPWATFLRPFRAENSESETQCTNHATAVRPLWGRSGLTFCSGGVAPGYSPFALAGQRNRNPHIPSGEKCRLDHFQSCCIVAPPSRRQWGQRDAGATRKPPLYTNIENGLADLLRDGDGEAVGIEQYSELFSEVLRGRRQRELDAFFLHFRIKCVEVEDLERNLRAAGS